MAKYFYGESTKDHQWYFRLVDGNNKTILSSTEGYTSKQSCLKGIDSVKAHSLYDQNYRIFTGTDNKYYFTLRASNGEPIGKSEGYDTSYGRDQGKENCKREAPYAQVQELVGSYV